MSNGGAKTDNDRLISMREVCEITSWSRSSINRLVERGELSPPVKLGTQKIAFLESDIRAYVASRQRRYSERIPEPTPAL